MRPRGRRGAQATWSAARGETPVLSLRTENWVVATNEPDVTGDPSRAGGSGVKESRASFCAWSQLRVGSREPRDRMCACACRRTPVGVRGSPSPRCQPGTRRGGSCRPPRGGPALRRGRWMSDGPLQPAPSPAPTPEGATGTRELWGWGARARGGFAQVSSGGHRERDLRPQGSEVCLSNPPSSLRPGDGQRATLGCLSSQKGGDFRAPRNQGGAGGFHQPRPLPSGLCHMEGNTPCAWQGGGSRGREAGPGPDAGMAPAMHTRQGRG